MSVASHRLLQYGEIFDRLIRCYPPHAEAYYKQLGDDYDVISAAYRPSSSKCAAKAHARATIIYVDAAVPKPHFARETACRKEPLNITITLAK